MQMMAASMKTEARQVWWVWVTWKINPFPKGCWAGDLPELYLNKRWTRLETTTEPVQEDPTRQSGGSGRQQEEGAKVVNRQEVGISSPAIGDTC